MSPDKNKKSFLLPFEELIPVLFLSGKIVFLISSFLFFFSYVAMTSGFYGELFFPFFLPLYIAFVLSANIFLGISIFYLFHSRVHKLYLLPTLIVPIVCTGLFLYPVM